MPSVIRVSRQYSTFMYIFSLLDVARKHRSGDSTCLGIPCSSSTNGTFLYIFGKRSHVQHPASGRVPAPALVRRCRANARAQRLRVVAARQRSTAVRDLASRGKPLATARRCREGRRVGHMYR